MTDRPRPIAGVRSRLCATGAALWLALPQRWPGMLRSTLAVLLPLLIGVMAGAASAGAQAAIGGLTALYAGDAPYAQRSRLLAGVGAGMTAAALAGGLAGGHGWLTAAVAVTVAAGLASHVCQAWAVPPPRETMPILALLTAGQLGGSPLDALHLAALIAAGGAGAWLIAMAPALRGRYRPERRMLAGALGSIAGYLDALGRPGESDARHRAVLAVERAGRAVRGRTSPADRLGPLAAGIDLLLAASLRLGVDQCGSGSGWAAAVRGLRLTPGPRPARLESADPDNDSAAAMALAAAIDRLQNLATRQAPRVPPHEPVLPGPIAPVPTGRRIRARLIAAAADSVVGRSAGRVGVATGLGVVVGIGLSQLAGTENVYWTALTACAVIQASNLTLTRIRVLNRIAGTVVGLAIVFGLLSVGPPVPLVLGVVAVAQAFVDWVIAVNYGLAVIGITILALLMFDIASPTTDVSAFLLARLVDTVAGAVIALLVRRVLWPRSGATQLSVLQARTLTTSSALLSRIWATPTDRSSLSELSGRLYSDIVELRVVQDDVVGDGFDDPARGDLMIAITSSVEHLALLVLSVPPDRPPPTDDPRPVLDAVENLAKTLTDGGGLDRLHPPPPVPGYPHITACFLGLTMAMDALRG